MSFWMRPRLTRCECRYQRSPSSPDWSSARILVTAGLYSKVWPTISTREARSAWRARAAASAVDRASGFSTSTCLPASRACLANAAWVAAGVATTTASIAGSASTGPSSSSGTTHG
jgi:hypothetical protein